MSLFVHLRVHSQYSVGESSLNLYKIKDFITSDGVVSIALTDTNNMFGAREFSSVISKEKIKPIIGIELTVLFNNVVGNLVLLAKNANGYKNLLNLHDLLYKNFSKSNLDTPIINLNDIIKYKDDIILLTGGLDGLLANCIKNNKTEVNTLIDILKHNFNNNLYIELNRFFLQEDFDLEKEFLDIANKNNLPIVATNNAKFINPSYHKSTEILMCIGQGVELSNPNRKILPQHSYLKTQQEMVELFKDLPEAIENTINIAKKCNYFVDKQELALPSFIENENEFIKQQAIEGLKYRLETIVYKISENNNKEELEKIYFERLYFELDIIIKMGFSGYFLIVSDFIKWAKNNDIPVGPGRGSGAGSLVAWALFIIDVDPIQYKLFFERFLNPFRISMPDFDIDFCGDNRDRVIEYVKNKYGIDKVGSIITFGTLQPRAAIKDVGRVMGVLYSEVDALTKKIPYSPPSKPLNLTQIVEGTQAIKDAMAENTIFNTLIKNALQLEGLYRNISTHAAGVVISKYPLKEVIPVYYDKESEFASVGFSMKYIEDVGLVKFDFLALKTLTIIKNTIDEIKKVDINFDILTIPTKNLDKISDILAKGTTLGVFQIESGGMTEVVKHIKPTNIEEIIAIISLYRPGPMENIPSYINRKHGKEKIEYLHNKMADILQETYGIMIYQEQVMEVAKVIAGYSLGEADLLRRSMGKKDAKEMEKNRDVFIKGAKEHNNINTELATEIFNQMEKFASYGFNKSHATAYAMISWQTAYLKAYYPAEFLANVMTSDMNNIDKFSLYIEEAKKFNIAILSPSINYPSLKFTIQNLQNNQKAIRYSLLAIKGLSEHFLDFIINYTNENGPFKNLEDFLTKVPSKLLNKKQIEALIKAGALDEFNNNRKELLENVEKILQFNNSANAQANDNQINLFGDEDKSINKLILKTTNYFIPKEQLELELEVLGCFLSGHPLNAWQDFIEQNKLKNYSDIIENRLAEFRNNDYDPKNVDYVLGYLMKIKLAKTKNGNSFANLTFYDKTSIFTVILFGENYTKFAHILKEGEIYVIKANLKIDNNEEVKLFVSNLEVINKDIKISKLNGKNKSAGEKLTKDTTQNNTSNITFNQLNNIADGYTYSDNDLDNYTAEDTTPSIEILTNIQSNYNFANVHSLENVDLPNNTQIQSAIVNSITIKILNTAGVLELKNNITQHPLNQIEVILPNGEHFIIPNHTANLLTLASLNNIKVVG